MKKQWKSTFAITAKIFAVNTYKFLENRPVSLEKLKSYLELASSSMLESSNPTPPISRILGLIKKNQ